MSALGATAATIFSIGMTCIMIGVSVVMTAKRWRVALWGFSGIATGALFVFVTLLILAAGGSVVAFGRDLDGRYSQSPLKQWFDSLKSGKGPCCSDADGSAVSDVDWESSHGRYRVRLYGEWYDVPDDALITEPNRVGRAMVWPLHGYQGVTIRCFMPGSMS